MTCVYDKTGLIAQFEDAEIQVAENGTLAIIESELVVAVYAPGCWSYAQMGDTGAEKGN